MAYTIMGFVPGIGSIDIYVNGVKIAPEGKTSSDTIKRSYYLGYMGSSAPLYFADKNSDLLLEVSRSIEQGKTWSAYARLLELLKGPLSGDDENAWPVIPSGITEEDILSVDVYEDTAYVNLSQKFKEDSTGLSSKNEMLLVYAIVNTITAMDGISKVQFLIEGQQTDTLAGYICLSDPFLRNYGIIKQSS
jgi:spore germination protein GerM